MFDLYFYDTGICTSWHRSLRRNTCAVNFHGIKYALQVFETSYCTITDLITLVTIRINFESTLFPY